MHNGERNIVRFLYFFSTRGVLIRGTQPKTRISFMSALWAPPSSYSTLQKQQTIFCLSALRYTPAGRTQPCITSCKLPLFPFLSLHHYPRARRALPPFLFRSGWGFTWALLPYGESWRAGRRTFTKHFNSSNPGIHQPRERRYVQRFLRQLYEHPEEVLDHVRK
jgi:hypothetical protein